MSVPAQKPHGFDQRLCFNVPWDVDPEEQHIYAALGILAEICPPAQSQVSPNQPFSNEDRQENTRATPCAVPSRAKVISVKPHANAAEEATNRFPGIANSECVERGSKNIENGLHLPVGPASHKAAGSHHKDGARLQKNSIRIVFTCNRPKVFKCSGSSSKKKNTTANSSSCKSKLLNDNMGKPIAMDFGPIAQPAFDEGYSNINNKYTIGSFGEREDEIPPIVSKPKFHKRLNSSLKTKHTTTNISGYKPKPPTNATRKPGNIFAGFAISEGAERGSRNIENKFGTPSRNQSFPNQPGSAHENDPDTPPIPRLPSTPLPLPVQCTQPEKAESKSKREQRYRKRKRSQNSQTNSRENSISPKRSKMPKELPPATLEAFIEFEPSASKAKEDEDPNLERMRKRVIKMLRLVTHSGTPEAEIERAMSLAKRQLQKYNLDCAELFEEAKKAEEVKGYESGHVMVSIEKIESGESTRMEQWMEVLAIAVAENFEVEFFSKVEFGLPNSISFYGLFSNAKLAADFYVESFDAMHRLTKAYNPLPGPNDNKSTFSRQSRNSYVLGLAEGVARRVKIAKQNCKRSESVKDKAKLMALIVATERAPEEALKKLQMEEDEFDSVNYSQNVLPKAYKAGKKDSDFIKL